MAAFGETGLMPELISAVVDLGWKMPTPIQTEAVPLVLGGGDVMAAAETGSGKTGAFALPVIQIVHETLTKQQEAQPVQQQRTPCVLSQQDHDPELVVAADGLAALSHQPCWTGGRATVGAFTGKFAYEVHMTSGDLCRVGWAAKNTKLELGVAPRSFGYGSTGMKVVAKKYEAYGQAYGKGDVITCLLDWEAAAISYARNGEALGVACAIPQKLQGEPLYPCILLKGSEVAVNFGGAPFAHPLPDGFVGLADGTPMQTASSDTAISNGHTSARQPTAIILEPARELAEQTVACLRSFVAHLPAPQLRIELFVGGLGTAGARRQAAALREEGVDIAVGTPGHIMDLVENGKLDVQSVHFLVLDEADRMLQAGDSRTVLKLYQRLPKAFPPGTRLQVLLFSATLHTPQVAEFADKVCQKPMWIDLKGRDVVPEAVQHCVVTVDPRSDLQAGPERQASLQAFRGGKVRFLICTDVAARGLDIHELPFLVNMTLPDNAATYIHRVGRVGRADKPGVAISLVAAAPEKVWFLNLKTAPSRKYKPWTLQLPEDRRLQQEGGHAVWLTEQDLLQEVEDKLGHAIRRRSVAAPLLPRAPGASEQNELAYGNKGQDGSDKPAPPSMAVAEHLAQLEAQIQRSYFALKRKWSRCAG
ncbi:hypothetical protein WJX72_003299 [[Myrmecia] bisecta]|uniref:DEAD box protein 1 n=1 Tax=[Myrmecia] bisecta TaxID=41462 RepID=A0AAW1Q6W5_9CHLO